MSYALAALSYQFVLALTGAAGRKAFFVNAQDLRSDRGERIGKGKQGKQSFFEKKDQKTFASSHLRRSGRLKRHPSCGECEEAKAFAFFSKKKALLLRVRLAVKSLRVASLQAAMLSRPILWRECTRQLLFFQKKQKLLRAPSRIAKTARFSDAHPVRQGLSMPFLKSCLLRGQHQPASGLILNAGSPFSKNRTTFCIVGIASWRQVVSAAGDSQDKSFVASSSRNRRPCLLFQQSVSTQVGITPGYTAGASPQVSPS